MCFVIEIHYMQIPSLVQWSTGITIKKTLINADIKMANIMFLAFRCKLALVG